MTRVHASSMAHGGDAVARLEGLAVFVPGGMPGETLDVEVVERRKRFARARLIDVVEPSPDRIEPPCPHFSRCGGCTWQFAPLDVQHRWKQETVASQLSHIGKLSDVAVRPIWGEGDGFHYRNRVDLRTKAGRPTLYEARSHMAVPLDVCLLLAEPLEALFDRLDGVDVPGNLTLRAGIRTGQSAVIVETEDSAAMLRERGLPGGTEATSEIVEVVAGQEFRISGRAFFQVNTIGADALVGFATEAAGNVRGAHLLDAYAGVGLFAATVGEGAARITLIESDPVAIEDLRVNLGDDVEVIGEATETGLDMVGGRPDVVIVDPPRSGLGADVVNRFTALAPRVIVSVSCDPASFARDARALVDAGYVLEWVQPVDLFPQTPHVETVARFVRA